ncbi:MAG: ComF family protein, partial [Chloroflexi bacterium]|nr:ComF family protein [Chloroflexota bacterium]
MKKGFSFWDWLFPPQCVACGARGAWLCADCIAAMPRIMPPFCPHCGEPQRSGRPCRHCAERASSLEGIRSVGLYAGPLQRAIWAFKYEGLWVLVDPLASLLEEYYRGHPWPVDLVMPVPLHRRRERRRGYNQSALLARTLAKRLALPYEPDLLVRRRDTPSQVGKSREERYLNMEGAFACARPVPSGARILLVDDVLTTGATLEACAAPLKSAGAATVWGMTLARAALDADAVSPF